METPILRSRTLLAMGTELPLAAGFEFISEKLRAVPTLLDVSGWRGTRSQLASRVITAMWAVSGTVVMQPSLGELARLLPWLLGARLVDMPPGSVTCTLAETIPSLHVLIDRGARVYGYSGCKIVLAELSAKKDAPLEVSLSFEGVAETIAAAGTFPEVEYAIGPLLRFESGEVAIGGALREIEHAAITVENVARTDRFVNSTIRVDVPIVDRRIRLRCEIPYSDDVHGLYETAAISGPATLRFFAGGSQATWEFPSMRFAVAAPTLIHEQEMLQLDGMAGRTADSDALWVIHTDEG